MNERLQYSAYCVLWSLLVRQSALKAPLRSIEGATGKDIQNVRGAKCICGSYNREL